MWFGGPKIDCGFDDDIRKSFEYSDAHLWYGMV